MDLKFSGKTTKVYKGMDPITNQDICAIAGDTVSVSMEKGNQLIQDFPTDWTVVGKASEPEHKKEEKPEVKEAPKAKRK